MSTTVTIGGSTITSFSTDDDYVQTAVTLPGTASITDGFKLSGGTWVANNPLVITSVRTYVASYDGVGDIVVSIGGFSGTYNNVGIDSTPGLSSWKTVSGTFALAGTSTNFRLNPSTQGGVYFKRSSSGTTTKQDGYTWAGAMYGQYQYIEVPVAPSGFSATESGAAGLVNFAWTAPSDNGGSAVTGYEIYRGTSSGAITTLIGSTTGTTFSYTAPDTTTYHYTVRAKNAVTTASGTLSEAATSDTATAVLSTSAQAPTSLSATPNASPGQIDLAWTAPVSPATATYGYRIYQGGVLIHTISVSSNPAETHSVTGLTAGVSYSFFVTALSSASVESSASNTATAVAPGAAPAPAALSVSSTFISTSIEVAGQLRISWTAVAGVGSTGGYKLYRDGVQIAGSGVAGSLIGHMTAPFYIDSNLTAGQSYSYTVRAYLSSPSEVGDLTTPATGIPSASSFQIETGAVTNLTNDEFAGQFTSVVDVIDATTFSYPVAGGTSYTQVLLTPSSAGTISSELAAIFNVDKTMTKITDTTFTVPAAAEPNITTPRVITSTVTNKTNQALNGTHVLPAGTTAGTTITYAIANNLIAANITTVSVSGTVANLDSGALTKADATITAVPTGTSFTFVKADVADLAETVLTGTATVSANDVIYNGNSKTITATPRPDQLTYVSTVPNSGPTSEDIDISFPLESAVKTSSSGYVEIKYRSGWIG